MISFDQFINEGIKKSQIDDVFNNDDFKVGLEFEFYNDKFLQSTGRPSSEETLLLGLYTDIINESKKFNRKIITDNIKRKTNLKSIVTDTEIFNDFEVKDRKILVNFFTRNGIPKNELYEMTYYYVTHAGKNHEAAFNKEDFKQNIFDKYEKQDKKIKKFIDILSKVTQHVTVGHADIKRFYSKENNLPSMIQNPQITTSETSSMTKWSIKQDLSVSPMLGGIEFISPPMKPKDAIAATATMFNFIKQNGNTKNYAHEDSDKKTIQCGLHINISYLPNRMKNFDPLKFILFSHESQVNQKKIFGDRKIADLIGGNLKKIRTLIKVSKNEADFEKGVEDILKTDIKNIAKYFELLEYFSKYFNINFENYNEKNKTSVRAKSERIEVRYFGGEGYEDKFTVFKRVLGELLYALDVATDAEKEKDLYYKKIYKLFKN